jgi:type IV pilus assembly protein PilO
MAVLPQNQRDQVLLVVCVALLGLGYVYYQYLWTPKSEQLAALEARVDTLKSDNEKSRRDIARGTAGKLRQEADMYGRMLAVMRQLVPVANEVPTLLEQISTAARRTGLELNDVTPLGTIPGDVFETHRYRMAVTGPYHRVAQFLNNVGSLTRIVAPMNVSLTPSGKSMRVRAGEQPVDASFEIQTYVAKTPPPQISDVPPRGQ